MSRKLFSLITCLVLVLNFGVVPGSVQADEGGGYEVWPVFIDPPDGSVDIMVPSDANVVIRTSFTGCSRLLAAAWTLADDVSLDVDGEALVSTRRESFQHWSRPTSILNEGELPCVNGSNTLWVVDWEYDLGVLDAGSHQVHFEENVRSLITDGADYDGDGRRDFFRWNVAVDFSLIVNEMGSISGTVTSEYGDPVPGLWVDACDYDTESYCSSAETNENGYYSILLPPGEYWVQVWVEQDWIGQRYDADQDGESDRVAVIVGEDTAGIDFELLAAGTISGRVTSEYGDPLAGLWVDACEYDNQSYCGGAETDDDGYYSILLPPGEYWVQVWVEQDWIGQVYDVDPQDGVPDRVAVIVGEDTAGIDFELLAAGTISGRVTSEYGDPLAGLWVDACEYDNQSYCGSAETDDDGYYSILLPPGEYWVQIFPETDWIGKVYDVGPQDGEPDRVAVIVGEDTAGIDFELLAAGVISGTVTTVDVEGNTVPVTELWVDACHESVSLEMWGNSPLCNGAQTDQDGFYTIPRLLPGNYRVVTWGNDDLSLQFYDGVLNYYEANLVTVEPGQIREGVDFSLFASGPAFNAWPVENYVDGWDWEIGVPVNLSISNGYTEVLYPFVPDWNPNTTWVISQGEFELQPGDIVTLDNGIYTKQTKVTGIAITSTDLVTSSVSGTATPGSHVYVWYYSDEGRVDRHEVADDFGNWTANFSVPGDELGEEQTYTIPAGAGGEANQVDFDGDGTQVNWWMPWE